MSLGSGSSGVTGFLEGPRIPKDQELSLWLNPSTLQVGERRSTERAGPWQSQMEARLLPPSRELDIPLALQRRP